MPGFQLTVWWGLTGPAHMPAPVVKRLNDELNAVLAAPDVAELLAREAATPQPGSPEQFGKTITVYAHRFANELAFGPIPEGIEVDHCCEDVSTRLDELNTLCMNPAHHERVGGVENKRRQGERKNVCKHGHLYTAENTYIDGRGHRRCRRCAQERRWAA